jgi:hypothetical protein
MTAPEPPPFPPPPTRTVEVEVLPPAPPLPPGFGATTQPPPVSSGGFAVHPIAALLLLVVDNLWNLADWTILGWFITVPLSFLSVAVPTFILQRKRLLQSSGKALGWAVLLGGIAAVPFSVGGTTIGALLLAWLGIRRLSDKPSVLP